MSRHANQHPGRVAWSIRKRQALAGEKQDPRPGDLVDRKALAKFEAEQALQKLELIKRLTERRKPHL